MSNSTTASSNQARRLSQSFVRWVIGLALAVMLLSGSSFAQTQTDRIASWTANIEQAQMLLARPLAGNIQERIDTLEKQRATLAIQRDAALAATKEQPFEATIVAGKLKLMGPPPETGDSPFIAERRRDLEQELYELQAPVRRYEDVYLRSVALIANFDSRIAALNRTKLTTRARSPLWPQAWVAFVAETERKIGELFVGTKTEQPRVPSESKATLTTLSLALLIFGMLIVTIVRRAVGRRLSARAQDAVDERKFILWAIAKDFFGVTIALLGLAVVSLGTLVLIGVLPAFGKMPLAILIIGAPIILAHWLGLTLFAPHYPRLRFVHIKAQGAHRAVWLVLLLGLAIGLESLVENAEENAPYSMAASGVGPFLVIALISASVYFLATTIERNREESEKPPEAELLQNEQTFVNRRIDWGQLITKVMRLSAVIAFMLASIGFAELARWAILPVIKSLLILAILAVIFSRIVKLLRAFLFDGTGRDLRELLALQVCLFFCFSVVAAPMIAIVWGIRPAEILDLLSLLRDGVTVGGVTVSFGTVVIFVSVFVIGYVLTRWVQRILQTALLARIDLDDGTRSAVVTGVGYLGVILSFIGAVGAAGLDLSNLAIVFGALSVGIGFGMQSVVANFLSGIIMLIERPIKEGDSIVVGDYAGIVRKISVRATRIQSFDHDDVIIPNSELIAGAVRNRTLTDIITRIECAVGIAYGSDISAAFDTLYKIADDHERTVQDPPPKVVMEELGDSAVLLRLYCFIDDVGATLSAKSEIYVEILKRFSERGIVIPFPQSEVTLNSPEPGN
ncbi:mechanosensitive ion channel family protein [Tsuneonella mangrovi]|uniref:mechanosensitive ion channel family protein n=1 Tax=Tsuneonella mangrovi TaxID=1982042 RepID=UPI000BA27509|nr:mechanosensitive ion channel domain-containing protein [Tsuneonella mangrovi]